MDKAAHLQYIAACEQVRLSYRDTTQGHEKQAAQKRKERRNKKYPQDKKALHGPPDKSTNFASTTTPKTSKRKQLPPAQNEVQPKSKKTAEHLSVVTRPSTNVSKVSSFV